MLCPLSSQLNIQIDYLKLVCDEVLAAVQQIVPDRTLTALTLTHLCMTDRGHLHAETPAAEPPFEPPASAPGAAQMAAPDACRL